MNRKEAFMTSNSCIMGGGRAATEVAGGNKSVVAAAARVFFSGLNCMVQGAEGAADPVGRKEAQARKEGVRWTGTFAVGWCERSC